MGVIQPWLVVKASDLPQRALHSLPIGAPIPVMIRPVGFSRVKRASKLRVSQRFEAAHKSFPCNTIGPP